MIKRLLRSRGHGVHSPFAYRFITGVIREHCEYYAYTHLEQMAQGRELRNAKLLHRITAALPTGLILIAGELTPALQKAVEMANSKDTIREYKPGEDAGGATPVAVVITDPGRLDSARQAYPDGMMFAGKHSAVIVPDKALPSQQFEIIM